MKKSVTWYFQTRDYKLEFDKIQNYIYEIVYGNQMIRRDIAHYCGNNLLMISPIEQVKLLWKLHDRQLPFSNKTIEAVEHAICLSSTDNSTVYGKTGTLKIKGKNACGWFMYVT